MLSGIVISPPESTLHEEGNGDHGQDGQEQDPPHQQGEQARRGADRHISDEGQAGEGGCEEELIHGKALMAKGGPGYDRRQSLVFCERYFQCRPSVELIYRV